jgi:hypothetical protein
MVLVQCYLGIMGQGQLSPLSLVQEYLRRGHLSNAVSLLSGMNWNLEGAMSYACLQAVANRLLRMPLNPENEGLCYTLFHLC